MQAPGILNSTCDKWTYIVPWRPGETSEVFGNLGGLRCKTEENTMSDFIGTVVTVHGIWTAGGPQKITIHQSGSSLNVSMRAYGRPRAHGSVLDPSTITVTFPDDKTYTGRLQPPDFILWSNGTVWTRVDDVEG